MSDDNKEWKCWKCDLTLKARRTVFCYLGNSLTHEVLCCPKCGRVFIPAELADGKMAEAEKLMEDK